MPRFSPRRPLSKIVNLRAKTLSSHSLCNKQGRAKSSPDKSRLLREFLQATMAKTTETTEVPIVAAAAEESTTPIETMGESEVVSERTTDSFASFVQELLFFFRRCQEWERCLVDSMRTVYV